METTVKADKYNIIVRTNDNYILNVGLGYDLGTAIPRMSMKRLNEQRILDLSDYLYKNGNNGFMINIPASVLNTLIAGVYNYDCVLDLGGGSKTFLFGGVATVIKGLT